MSREIKFRVWDNENKTMLYEGKFGNGPRENEGFTKFIESEGDVFEIVIYAYGKCEYNIFQDATIMQFTGLLDCKGNPIYEGDLVSGFDNIFTVKFGIARFEKLAPNKTWNAVDCPSFFFETKEGIPVYPIVNNYRDEHDLQTLEIVGNIYEKTKEELKNDCGVETWKMKERFRLNQQKKAQIYAQS